MKPKPKWFTTREGGDWIAWGDWKSQTRFATDHGVLVHSVMFEDGSVFDAVNGWRTTTYCPHCWKEKHEG